MPDLFTQLGPWTFRTFTLALVVSAGASLALAAWRLRQIIPFAALVDAALGALVGAAVVGRLGHVALNLAYFRVHPEEIFRLNLGGVNWHGALVGGLFGLFIVSRWRRLKVGTLLDALTPALPLLMAAGWVGCAAAGCGYGREVDTLARYPAGAVWEARDVYGMVAPRWNTPLFGLLAAGAVLLVVLLGGRLRKRESGALFWLALALVGAGMFAVGFLRADAVPLLAGLRLDSWLDLCMVVFGVIIAGYQFTVDRNPPVVFPELTTDR
jgi:phosphatidylglycerol:prolipoprotein diacylglycerol transferase